MMRLVPFVLVLVALGVTAGAETPQTVERWGVFELILEVVWSSPTMDPQPIPAERLFHRAE